MDCILTIPINVHTAFVGRCLLASREYALLKNSVIDELAAGKQIIETVCELEDAELLLAHAKHFYPEAVPYILKGLSPDSGINGN